MTRGPAARSAALEAARKQFDRNKRLIEAGETYRSHKPSTFRRGK